jgi:hypothetical protein
MCEEEEEEADEKKWPRPYLVLAGKVEGLDQAR